MHTKTYTTSEAAERIGVSRQALYLWIGSGKIEAPKQVELGKRSMRFWTKADIEKARRFKGTLKPGPKRKKRGKSKRDVSVLVSPARP